MIDLNVILLPDAEATENLLSLSDQLAKNFDVDYKLDRIDRPPHLSLYSALYPIRNTKKLVAVMEQISSLASGLTTQLSGFANFSGYIFYKAVLSEELQRLHEAVVDTLNPLREGLISEGQKRLTGLTPKQEDAIKQYGYVSVKHLFMPHITLAHINGIDQASAAIQSLPNRTITFNPRSLSLVPFDLSDRLGSPVVTYSI